MFGKTASINTTELAEDWNEINNTVTAKLDTAVGNIREFLGIKKRRLITAYFIRRYCKTLLRCDIMVPPINTALLAGGESLNHVCYELDNMI